MRNLLVCLIGCLLALGPVLAAPAVQAAVIPDTCVLNGPYFVTAFTPSLDAQISGLVTLTPTANCALAGALAGTLAVTPVAGAPTTLPLAGSYSVAPDFSLLVSIPGLVTVTGQVGLIASGIANSFAFAGIAPGLVVDGVGFRREPGGFLGAADGSNTATGQGALASNTTGVNNTATGAGALNSNTAGSNNTATGETALFRSTVGIFNTATGVGALQANTTGNFNTAVGGVNALQANTTGQSNTAVGTAVLLVNTTGSNNTAVGTAALIGVRTGSSNIAVGSQAGTELTGGDHDNIHIGHTGIAGDTNAMRLGSLQTRTFIAGIRGTTTDLPAAVPILIDPIGQLGTISSSRRVKLDIQDMHEGSEALLKLRPVSFQYKAHADRHGPREYGLIAEEVAELLPDLVVYDRHGQPETIRYHLLPAMLLNELQKQHRGIMEQERVIAEQTGTIAILRRAVAAIEGRLDHLERQDVARAGR